MSSDSEPESPKPSRRSKRLLSKRVPTIPMTRPRRQVTKPPLVAISDSDDEEVIYITPKPAPLIDLTRNTPTEHLENPSATSPRDDDNKSPFEEPNQTSRKIKSTSPVDERLVTPPKQKKGCDENDGNIPLTPASTPSILLERLCLVASEEKNNRRGLFEENGLYQSARKALHSTCTTSMPGREKELEDMRDFILGNLNRRTSGSLYVSGPPGTGKTASLNLILEDLQVSTEINQVYVNCTSIKSSGAIFSRIAKELGVKSSGKSEKDYISAIEKYLQKPHNSILLVLDEIDQLESKRQSVLYTIFEWPANPKSRLILIGIANALDLTDRILPRLQARCELKPQLMHFAPYTKQQIVEIFTSRLKSAGALDIFTPVALQMLAGKVAAVSGDVRRALDIGRRVIELADRKKRGESLLRAIENLTTDLATSEIQKRIQIVDLTQVVSVLNNVYGTSQNFDEEVDDAFPLQQKIVVCSLLLILKKAKNKDVTIGRLHDVYRKVCTRRNIQVVDQGEFVGLCSLIETRGIIKIIKKKDPRMNKVSLLWDEEEVAAGLKDKQLMSMILQDDSCLGKL